MSSDPLEGPRRRIQAGDKQGARRQLVALLRSEPRNVHAWEMLAILLDDPGKRADCYRQILRIDPDNRQAQARLAQLTGQPAAAQPDPQAGGKLQCPTCGGTVDAIPIVGPGGQRVVCPYCGTEIDLAQEPPHVDHVISVGETFQAGLEASEQFAFTPENLPPDSPAHLPPPEVQELLKLLREVGLGALDDETLRRLKDMGITISIGEDGYVSIAARSRVVKIHRDSLPTKDLLTPEEIIRQAGRPLPPEQRRNCPNCDAVIPSDATRCPWCSVSLS